MPTTGPQQNTSPLPTTKDLALLLNKPMSWVNGNTRQLPTLRVGNALRFRATDIDAWLESSRSSFVR